MKQFFILIVLLAAGCTAVPIDQGPYHPYDYANPAPSASPKKIATPTPSPSPTPVVTSSNDGFTFACSNCLPAQAASLKHAREIILQVRKSKCFSDFMMNRDLEETDGLSNAQVLAKIKSWSQKAPVPIKFYTTKIYQSNNVIGYTYPGDPTIYANASYRSKYEWSDFAEASNLFHELTHKMGFDHLYSFDYTVPYSINRAVEACSEGDILQP